MSPSGKELIDRIQKGSGFIMSDVDTFNYLRYEKTEIINENDLGGGNFLSVLGLFAVTNFIAKVYKILQSGKLPNNSSDDTGFTEKDAFIRLTMDYKGNLLDSSLNAGDVWNALRDYPAHMASIPKGFQAATIINGGGEGDYTSIKDSINKNRDKAIFVNPVNKLIVCVIDFYYREVEEIGKWLVLKIAKNDFKEENIEKALDWLDQGI